MENLVDKPEYWSVKDMTRKQLYEEYLVSKFQSELSNKSLLLENFKRNFNEELRKLEAKNLVTYNTDGSLLRNYGLIKIIQFSNIQ